MDLCNPGEVRGLMETFHLRPRKEFGQNFLIDSSVVSAIAEQCCDEKDSTILEIGPGIGVLTRELAQRYRRVMALEIDANLIPVLSFTLTGYRNVSVICADVMKTNLEELLREAFSEGPVTVCANLPYYLTTPILMRLLESRLPFENITVMVQAEVAERLSARPGGRDYGAITASLGYYGQAQTLFTVPADRFLPAPKVNSAVVRIRLYKEKPCRPIDEDVFFQTIRAAFGQRRKTLVNALQSGFPKLSKADLSGAVLGCGFEGDVRGERLSTADFVRLADAITLLEKKPLNQRKHLQEKQK